MEKLENVKPFSMGYVLRVTARHMRKSIDISIRKTHERVADFQITSEEESELSPEEVEERRKKSSEVLETIMFLHDMRKQLDDFQLANTEQFRGK